MCLLGINLMAGRLKRQVDSRHIIRQAFNIRNLIPLYPSSLWGRSKRRYLISLLQVLSNPIGGLLSVSSWAAVSRETVSGVVMSTAGNRRRPSMHSLTHPIHIHSPLIPCPHTTNIWWLFMICCGHQVDVKWTWSGCVCRNELSLRFNWSTMREGKQVDYWMVKV